MARSKRTAKGTFAKGVSGNPGGRPKEDTNLRDLAKEHTAEAVATLVQIMQNRKASPSSRIQACVAILDRGHGRPMQTLERDMPTPENDSPIDVLTTAGQIALVLRLAEQKLDGAEKEVLPR